MRHKENGIIFINEPKLYLSSDISRVIWEKLLNLTEAQFFQLQNENLFFWQTKLQLVVTVLKHNICVVV